MNASKSIQIDIYLDKEHIPEKIEWTADDNDGIKTSAKAFMLSVFEEHSKDTMRLDLWTKEFQMGEMDRFIYYSLKSMCETYLKATNNQELSNEFMAFVQHFGMRTELISNTNPS